MLWRCSTICKLGDGLLCCIQVEWKEFAILVEFTWLSCVREGIRFGQLSFFESWYFLAESFGFQYLANSNIFPNLKTTKSWFQVFLLANITPIKRASIGALPLFLDEVLYRREHLLVQWWDSEIWCVFKNCKGFMSLNIPSGGCVEHSNRLESHARSTH